MLLPSPRARVLLTVALPALLVLALLAGFLLLVHPVGTTDASSEVRGGHDAPSGTAGGADPVPQAVDSAPTISAAPSPAAGRATRRLPTRVDTRVQGPHPRTRHRRPSAAARDADLARWIASGHVAPATSSDLRPASGSADTGATSGAGSPATTGTVPGSGGSTTGAASADFVLSSFNVLGASHTRNGGRGRTSGVVRIRQAAELLARHAVDVAGFQELQQVQARELLRVENGSWALFPGPGRDKDSENSVGWRTSRFELVDATTIPIPYFDGHHRQMPVVLLRDRASGVQAWFGNFHNPAETARYHHQQGWRNLATQQEIGLANRTRTTGVPLFITGDMNERAPYFCRLTAHTDLHAAHGGSNGPAGCDAGRPRAVDWIFGGPAATFSGYDEDRSHLVDITTDHPVISTRVHLVGSAG